MVRRDFPGWVELREQGRDGERRSKARDHSRQLHHQVEFSLGPGTPAPPLSSTIRLHSIPPYYYYYIQAPFSILCLYLSFPQCAMSNQQKKPFIFFTNSERTFLFSKISRKPSLRLPVSSFSNF